MVKCKAAIFFFLWWIVIRAFNGVNGLIYGYCCSQSPRREVPDHIQKPDYAETGVCILFLLILLCTVYQEDFVESFVIIKSLYSVFFRTSYTIVQ